MSYIKQRLVEQYEMEDEEREEFKQWKEQWFESLETPFQKMGFYGKKI